MNDDKNPKAPPSAKAPSKLVEGHDYTIDAATGYLVWTAGYLKRRGYCCESGCRNCPYGFKKR